MRTITFRPSWDDWCLRAADALATETTPDEIFWVPEEHDAQSTLPFVALHSAGSKPPQRPRPLDARQALPGEFARFAKLALHHRSEDRFALLYRLLWRLRHGEPELLDDMLDPDVFRLRRMAAAVRDDLKEARSRLRLHDPAFRAPGAALGCRTTLPDLVGWCEPRHRALPLLAEELAERTPNRSFALLSPQTSVFWDGRSLEHGPGVDRAEARSSGELAALWEARHHVAA